MEYVDIMVFIPFFSKEKIIYFKDEFLRDYVSSEEYYESPKYSSPIIFETENFSEMWNYVLEKRERSFTFYFENNKNEICPKAAIQINNDGSTCLVLVANIDYEEKCKSDLIKVYPDEKCIVSHNFYFMPFSREDFDEGLRKL